MYEYSFKLEVLIYSRPNLRDDRLEMEMFLGTGVLRSIFDKMETLTDIKNITLSFPERFLNILEQRQLFDRLEKYCPNLEHAQIKTHSPFIIQSTTNSCAYMMDDYSKVGDPSDLDVKLYTENHKHRLFNPDGLNVIGG